ncbi:hypothetical protein ACHAXT_005529 [Thalassiosira profunda]
MLFPPPSSCSSTSASSCSSPPHIQRSTAFLSTPSVRCRAHRRALRGRLPNRRRGRPLPHSHCSRSPRSALLLRQPGHR